MKNVDLHTGATRIRHGLQELMRTWEDAGDEWNDAVRERFYEERIAPIVPIVKNALDAAGRMQTLLGEAQRDMER